MLLKWTLDKGQCVNNWRKATNSVLNINLILKVWIYKYGLTDLIAHACICLSLRDYFLLHLDFFFTCGWLFSFLSSHYYKTRSFPSQGKKIFRLQKVLNRKETLFSELKNFSQKKKKKSLEFNSGQQNVSSTEVSTSILTPSLKS